jgi:hypothetical protein
MMEVADVYAVTEHGGPLGALLLFDAGNAAPSTPAVRVLPHGAGGQPAHFVHELGPGVQAVNVISGHEFIPGVVRPESGPTSSEYAALEPPYRDVLAQMNRIEEALQGSAGTFEDVLRLRNDVLKALDMDWPSTIWIEELLVIGHRLIRPMIAAGSTAEAKPLGDRIAREIIQRRWVGDGGPRRHFGPSEARDSMQCIAEIDADLRLLETEINPQSAPTTAPERPPKKRGFWRR